MDANEETYSLFDNYLSGNLSADEKAVFEKTLSENESLREEFTWMSSAVNSIRMSGNQLFKKQMAEIGKAIPTSALEKYSPSIKPRNFFRKYWWAVAAASAVIVAVSCWFVFNTQKHTNENKTDVAPVIDSVKKDSVAPRKNLDSFGYDSIIGPADSIFSEADAINQKPGFIGDEKGCRSFMMPVFSENKFYDTNGDSIKEFAVSSSSIVFRIPVTFCQNGEQPPYYIYHSDLKIYSDYSDSSKIVLRQNTKGEIIMTDGKPGFFILQRNKASNLVREGGLSNSKVKIDQPKKVSKSFVKPPASKK